MSERRECTKMRYRTWTVVSRYFCSDYPLEREVPRNWYQSKLEQTNVERHKTGQYIYEQINIKYILLEKIAMEGHTYN